MRWQTWTRFTAVILFLITVATFYFTYFDTEDPTLTFVGFPGDSDLDSLDNTEDITFTLYISNSAEETAFVDAVVVTVYDVESEVGIATVEPDKDFYVTSDTPSEVFVTLEAPGEDTEYTLITEVYYGEEKLVSDEVPVSWGTLLE